MSPGALHMFLGLCAVSAAAGAVRARLPVRPPRPVEGQRGKDAVWVPTPPALVEAMLDMAEVGPGDRVVDLGSGDGRIVIAAARRGAQALGVEYDARLVAVARERAADGGVAGRAGFVCGDLYEADISDATVIALFLLPDVLLKLRPRLLTLAPGTRIVTNRFGIDGWTADERRRIGGDSEQCCTALLYRVSP
jgi:SAM-dependent methyltransferase